MAEIRVTTEGGTGPADDADRTLLAGAAPVAGAAPARVTDPDHLIPAHTHAGAAGAVPATDDPDVVRSEIEATRARMSSTIDQLETVLARKKEKLEERLDVTAPVRDRPMMFAGAVFGGALLLGFLTGGKDDDEEEVKRLRRRVRQLEVGADVDVEVETHEDEWKARARQWEERARRLQKTCHRQDEEIRSLRSSLGGVEEEGFVARAAGGVRDSLFEGLAGWVSGLFQRNREQEYVVELEYDRGGYDEGEGGYDRMGYQGSSGVEPAYGDGGYADRGPRGGSYEAGGPHQPI